MEYLYHGSSKKIEILKPMQAFDYGYEAGRQRAVYATSNKNMALGFALGALPDANGEVERVMMPEYGDKIIFKKGTPNYGGKGYLYILDKAFFNHAMGTQWVCYNEIVPLGVMEIQVNDYLHLCEVIES